MIKYDKDEFLKPQIYSTFDEYKSRCNVTEEVIEEIEQLQKENEMLHHYKTLYQSLKSQKEELKEWLEESKKNSLAQHHVTGVNTCNIVMSKIEELEQESDNNE